MNFGVHRTNPHLAGGYPARVRKEIYRTYCAIPKDILTLETGAYVIDGQALGVYQFDPLNGLHVQLLWVDDRPHVLWTEQNNILWVDDDPDRLYS